MDRLLNKEEIEAWEKATGRKWKYTRDGKNTTNWNNEVEVTNLETMRDILYDVL